MLSKSILVAAFAAAAAATPMGTGSSAPYPTGGYSMTTSYYSAPTSYSSYSSASGYSSSGSVLGNPTASPNPVPSAGTVAKLLTEDSSVARFKEIQSEIQAGNLALKFDFNPAANPGVVPGEGGQVDLANRANFPILTDLGISAATIFFQPCGLNTPHVHPRASEFFTVATDSNFTTGFVLENGFVTELSTSLTQFQGTVFPMGSIHWQQNNDCKPAVAIAGLNSEDPGASSIAQNFLVNTNSGVVEAALGFPPQIDAKNFAQFKANIPAPLALGVEECLARCNIKY